MSSATERAYEIIRDAILNGDYPGGYRLREEDLAVRTGLSRTPVREAIRRLGVEGFINVEPRSGAVVSSWSLEQVEDLFEIRAILEGYGAFLAASKAKPSEVNELEAICLEMEKLVENKSKTFIESFSVSNKKLHTRILEMSGNQRLEQMATSLMDLSLIMRMYGGFSESRITRSCSDHRDIISAMRSNNPIWAESIMRSHILSSVELYREDVK